MDELLAALVGAFAALLGVFVAHLFQAKAEKKQRIGNAVLNAIALARQYQYDIREYGHAFMSIGESPKPLPDEDPESARQLSLDHSLKRFTEAERRKLDTEKELRLASVGLALYTGLHRGRQEDAVSAFDPLEEAMSLIDVSIQSAETHADIEDSVFKLGMLVSNFESDAVDYLRKHVDKAIHVPEHTSIGNPKPGMLSAGLGIERVQMHGESVEHADESSEFITPERCYILELWNDERDPMVSIARARVEVGVETQRHYLDGIDERYLIIQGTGRVRIGDEFQQDVGVGDVVLIPAGRPQSIENTGNVDLVFYCICSSRFLPDRYVALERNSE